MKESVLFLCLIMSMTMIKAQSVWEGGIFAGMAVYSGDINPTLTPRFQDFTPSIGLIAHEFIQPHGLQGRHYLPQTPGRR